MADVLLAYSQTNNYIAEVRLDPTIHRMGFSVKLFSIYYPQVDVSEVRQALSNSKTLMVFSSLECSVWQSLTFIIGYAEAMAIPVVIVEDKNHSATPEQFENYQRVEINEKEISKNPSSQKVLKNVIQSNVAESDRIQRQLQRERDAIEKVLTKLDEEQQEFDLSSNTQYNPASMKETNSTKFDDFQFPEFDNLQFPDEETREAWIVTAAVVKILSESPEHEDTDTQPITFDDEFFEKGFHAIQTAGSVIWTGKKGVVLVPKRTRSILEKLDIPYRQVSPDELI